jgi:iron complex transport system ATP-binding protein
VSLLSAQNLWFSYSSPGRRGPGACNAPPALRNVSFEVSEGEHIALVGPNGSGKTTLFQLLAGFESPQQGGVFLAGREIRRYPAAERARRMALVPQNSRPIFPYTCLEMVLMGLAPHRGRLLPYSDQELERAAEIMERLGVWEFAEKKTTELSGGELQRVILARALLQMLPESGPDGGRSAGGLLLLDEAMSEMDIAARIAVMKLLSGYTREYRIGIIGVYHDLQTPARFADRIIALSEGTIAADGSPETVFTQDFFAAVFQVQADIVPGRGFFLHDTVNG